MKLAILKRNLPRQACERYEEFPPGHVFDSKTAWPFADWGDWGETCGSEAAPDVLCGLDSARTSNITGMYWGPMATTSGWSAGQPSMAKPSNHRGVQIWRQPQLRILVFNPPIEKVVLIEEDQLGKLANKSPRPGFLARSPLYLMVFTTLKIAMYSNV